MMRVHITLALSMLLLVGAQLAIADTDARTVRTFKAKCAGCHGDDGKGATEQGKKMGIGDMTQAAWQKQFTDEQVKTAIVNGFKRDKNGKTQQMDAFGPPVLRPEQIDALVGYVRTFGK
jgi:mono/diheme cytochrome c family protein